MGRETSCYLALTQGAPGVGMKNTHHRSRLCCNGRRRLRRAESVPPCGALLQCGDCAADAISGLFLHTVAEYHPHTIMAPLERDGRQCTVSLGSAFIIFLLNVSVSRAHLCSAAEVGTLWHCQSCDHDMAWFAGDCSSAVEAAGCLPLDNV